MFLKCLTIATQALLATAYVIPKDTSPKIELYHVNNIHDIGSNSKYRDMLDSGSENVVFIIHETNSFLAKKKKEKR